MREFHKIWTYLQYGRILATLLNISFISFDDHASLAGVDLTEALLHTNSESPFSHIGET